MSVSIFTPRTLIFTGFCFRVGAHSCGPSQFGLICMLHQRWKTRRAEVQLRLQLVPPPVQELPATLMKQRRNLQDCGLGIIEV